MSITLDRRNFLSGSAALGAIPFSPIWATSPVRYAPTWPKVQMMLDERIAKKYVPGAGAAIARGLELPSFLTAGTVARGTGFAAVTPDTLWRLYSMTKPITGMAAMMLIEDGKMTLDQNIADFLPEFANPTVLIEPEKSLKSRPSLAPLSIRNLLTHTAGLGYNIITKGPLQKEYIRLGLTPGLISRKSLPGFDNRIPVAPSLDEFSKRLASLPLIADPSVKWSYSYGLDLMGRVIEVVSGMAFDAFVQQRIFGPLGMTSSFWQVPQSEIPRLTADYAATPFGAFEIDPAKDSLYLDKPAFPFGGAGLVSSMRDYDRFLAMLMGEGAVGETRIMKRETAQLAMSNLVHPKTEMTGFVKGQGFGAGGRVTLTPGPNGEGIGTYGWGGIASTIGWVDRVRGIRASGWAQIITGGKQPFVDDFSKAVYASL